MEEVWAVRGSTARALGDQVKRATIEREERAKRYRL
jgi:hypothetical protein